MNATAAMFSDFREARLSGGFEMGQRTTRWRQAPGSSSYRSIDSQIKQSEFETSWAVANELLLKHPYVKVAVDTFVSLSQIQTIMPEPDTDDPEVNRICGEWFRGWANDPQRCDVRGEMTFPMLTGQAVRLMKPHGDCGCSITPESQLGLVEAWRMRSPSRGRDPKWGVCGVVRDENGLEPVAYWVTKHPRMPDDEIKVDDVERYAARDEQGERIFLHPKNMGRIGSRGVSCLAPIADQLAMWQDGVYTQVVREQVGACLAFVEETSLDAWDEFKTALKIDNNNIKDVFDTDLRSWKASAAAYLRPLPGKTVKTLVPNINPANFQFIDKLILSALAVCVGCPELAIRLDAEKANFSQFRNVILQTKMLMRIFYDNFLPQWHVPIYRHVTLNLAASDTPEGKVIRDYLKEKSGGDQLTAKAREALLKVVFPEPTWEYIDPTKDSQADVTKLSRRLVVPRSWVRTTHGISLADYLRTHQDDTVAIYISAGEAKQKVVKHFAGDQDLSREFKAMPIKAFMGLPLLDDSEPQMPAEIDPELQADLTPEPVAPQQGRPSPEPDKPQTEPAPRRKKVPA